MNASDDLAVRSSGDPLFTVSKDGNTVQVFDWTHFCEEENLDETAKTALLEELLVQGLAERDGRSIELVNAQELTQQIEG